MHVKITWYFVGFKFWTVPRLRLQESVDNRHQRNDSINFSILLSGVKRRGSLIRYGQFNVRDQP